MAEKYLNKVVKIARSLLVNDPSIIFEVGARDCVETVAFSQNFPKAKIYAFECNPDTLPQCKTNISGYKNIVLIEKAVTDRIGFIDFFKINNNKTLTEREGGNSGASSIFEANPNYIIEKYVQDKITVPTTTIKSCVQEYDLKRIDLMWMDIQGAELIALRGAGAFLQNIAIINTEVEFFPIYKGQPLFSDIKKFMNENGFRLYTFSTIGKFAGDAMFINTKIIKKRFLLPEWFILLFHKTKEKVMGKSRVLYQWSKKKLKAYLWLYVAIFNIYTLFCRLKRILTENRDKRLYYEKINAIKENRKIVVDLEFGGIGDCLAYSTLPKLLNEKYNINFYLSRRSINVFRNIDNFKLCFEMNPYFKGFSDDREVFTMKSFESEKTLWTFFSDKDCESVIERLERQFDVKGSGLPTIYYKPRKMEEYYNIILIDKNYISGKKFGWVYRHNAFENEAEKYLKMDDIIEYVDTKRQDLFRYIDMIYSCKYFVTTFSGGASIAACFDKPFSVIWPINAKNSSNYQYRYKKSKGVYVE